MKKTLYVQKDESVAYLIDRIESTRDNDIYLNIDANPEIFSEAVNLKLLKREVAAFGKNVAIISENKELLSFIENAGFEVADVAAGASDMMQKTPQILPENQNEMIKDIKKPSFLKQDNQEDYQEIKMGDDEDDQYFDNEKEEEAENFFEKSLKKTRESDGINIFSKLKPKSQEESMPEAPQASRMLKAGKIFSNKKVTAISAIFLVIFVIGAFYIFKPKTTLTITIKKETIDFTFPLKADAAVSAVDMENKVIPGQVIKLEREVSGDFIATGLSSGATKATGTITIYNNYSKDSQALVARTRFESPDGKIFRISKNIIVPGAKVDAQGKVTSPGTINAEVTADQAGSDYNIAPATFTIPGFAGGPKFSGFYAKSTADFKGGSLGETRAVSKEDIDKAKIELTKKIDTTEEDYINANITKNFTILKNAIDKKVGEMDAPSPGTAIDQFTATIKVTYNIFVFEENNVSQVAESFLKDKIGPDRKIYTDTKVIAYEEGILDLDKSALNFTVRISEVTGGKINEPELKDQIAGKDQAEIKKILTANDAIESAEIVFWPLWSQSASTNVKSIEIDIKE